MFRDEKSQRIHLKVCVLKSGEPIQFSVLVNVLST